MFNLKVCLPLSYARAFVFAVVLTSDLYPQFACQWSFRFPAVQASRSSCRPITADYRGVKVRLVGVQDETEMKYALWSFDRNDQF